MRLRMDETQKATENVILMGSMVEETTRQVEELTDNANDMRNSSDEAFETLQNLGKINEQHERSHRRDLRADQ